MKHWWFFTGALMFVIIILINAPSGIRADSSQGNTGEIYSAPQTTSEGTVCCTFILAGEQRTCAAAPGRTCNDVCTAICDANP